MSVRDRVLLLNYVAIQAKDSFIMLFVVNSLNV